VIHEHVEDEASNSAVSVLTNTLSGLLAAFSSVESQALSEMVKYDVPQNSI
jgi:hypothetical protein